MQNTPQAFRGPGAPGVNFSEHSYDNHVGAHCPPSGYQPYTNPPYHPVPSPRSHHYANHQMQQNMPYRHHGGAYAPNQNQYGQNMNQEMYRNHHSNYVGAPNPRSMPNKPWSENASSEIMPPYGQVSHSQMMNNSSQISGNSMRSPPHATSNMNPTPPPNQQHFRQMQSPAHSPHSWSQAQIPSPGVMHSSRTTPSPLSTHVRSPGHSQQPFSPPATHAMNMPSHTLPPENGPSTNLNPSGNNENHNPSNPLHSLHKMVMLDQDPSKSMLPMMGDGSESFANPCGFVNEDGVSNESKDSAYSTYYNMDENRFESKPNNATNDAPAFSAVQQVSNCNFAMPSHALGGDNVKSNQPSSNSASLHEGLKTESASVSPNNLISSAPMANLPQNDCNLNSNECPPHAESAPVFTDQTKEAVATNSEQALETNLNPESASKITTHYEVPLADIPKPNTGEPASCEEKVLSAKTSNTFSPAEIKPDVEVDHDKQQSFGTEDCSMKADVSSDTNHDDFITKDSIHCKKEVPDSLKDATEQINKPAIIKLVAEVHKSENEDIIPLGPTLVAEEICRDRASNKLEINANGNCLSENSSLQSSNLDIKPNIKTAPFHHESSTKSKDSDSNTKVNDVTRNPVKVVIHRIRKDDTNDTWHVPGNPQESLRHNTFDNVDKKPGLPKVGPQIVILSPAKSQKKFGFQSSVASDNVISIDEDISIIEMDDDQPENKCIKEENSFSAGASSSSDKKRGRPAGSKNKIKTNNNVKKKRNRKGSKKKKVDLLKSEILSKPKKLKVFSGPYVHIVGKKDNPSSIKVVNVAQKEEEKVSKTQSKRIVSTLVNRIKKPVGHLSTLSPTYDAFNRDKTWLCVFCQKGSHFAGLGDLYGPYYIKDNNPELSKSSSSTPSSSSSKRKRRKSEVDDTKGQKRARHNASHSNEPTPQKPSSKKDTSADPEAPDMREVWIHEDCAVWCQNISLLGEEVQGLEEAVAEASENTCCKCSLHGATLDCWGKGCKEQYHYSCAKNTGCQMDIEKFSLLCPKHQKNSRLA